MSNVKGAFTVRFVKNGDTIYIVRDIVDAAGDGSSLYQAIDPTTGKLSKDWTDPAKQPIVQLRALSARNFLVTVNSVTWAYDGTTLTFNSAAETSGDYAGWQLCNTPGLAGKFAIRATTINGYTWHQFRILDNIASLTQLSNKQLTYTVEYTCNSMHDTITESMDIEIQQAGSSSYKLTIMTNHSRLDNTNNTATLRAEIAYGVEGITLGTDADGNTYSIKWYQDGVELTGKSGLTLTVNRDNQNNGNPYVDGASVFVAKLLRNNVVVAQDAQSIIDDKDEYGVSITPRPSYSPYIDENNDTQLQAQLTRQDPSGNKTNVSGATYSWTLYNATGKVTANNLSGQTVTVKAEHALCEILDNSGKATGETYYGDVECSCTATYNL